MVHLGPTLQRIGLYGLSLLGSAHGRLQPRQSHASEASATNIPKELTGCHLEQSRVHCTAGSKEYEVIMTVSGVVDPPTTFTDCHEHDGTLFCVAPDGDDVKVVEVEDEDHGDHDHDHGHEDGHGDSSSGKEGSSQSEEPAADEASAGLNCHFHAGVEHCDGGNGEAAARNCSRVQRDYNIPLRIGLIFAMLATSTLGVYLPIFAVSFVRADNIVFTILRQFGTGIIISTAFVHLFIHANLMFQNECLGDRIQYESTAAAILMAGLFLSFLIEYAGARIVQWHGAKSSKSIEDSSDGTAALKSASSLSSELINIYVLEAGIIFHSFLIGLTLVVSGDAFFITLFIVIVFHQFFEGLALGTRIASLGLTPTAVLPLSGHSHGHHHHAHIPIFQKPETSPVLESHQSPSAQTLDGDSEMTPTVSRFRKVVLAALFAFITPAGMALGTGILSHFNGNDPATLIAIGTLDAFSAGILVWVGVVEMWAADWMMGGEMTSAGPLRTILGLGALMMGMALMSLLGKWA